MRWWVRIGDGAWSWIRDGNEETRAHILDTRKRKWQQTMMVKQVHSHVANSSD